MAIGGCGCYNSLSEPFYFTAPMGAVTDEVGPMEQHSIKVIARIRSDFKTKFGVPRQSGLVEALRARIVFEPEYRNADALRGIEGFSHLWLIWQFSEAVREDWSPTVRPPRLGGNERMGVFATRSPFRPNAIGLSCVRLEGVEQTAEGSVLLVSGADLMDGTPIYDIKPYLPYADCKPEASGGFAPQRGEALAVDFPPALLERAAVLAAGGTIILPKQAGGGVTFALALRPFAPDWRWQDA